ncbi:SET domain-containing protein-lysine N-methyltransferase [Pedococcus sp. KACC 23699]|uniref:SET domain-containing protein-lysine N-methyltransferase n=1 Tax=Pedococcus sp. KACC 23699 TaxID=3149228 RepID=A0AAU7JQL8_9MICO
MAIERRASAIAGRGVFTGAMVLIGEVVDVDPAALNHSCDPTLAWSADGRRLVAFRDIEPGEELTVDYATGSTDPDLMVRCHCETYRCRQLVTGDDWRIPQVQQRYAGHLAPVVQRAVDASA